MFRNTWKNQVVLLLTCGATMLGFGGCLGLNLERVLQLGAAYAATEFVFDNDDVFDLFPDGAGM